MTWTKINLKSVALLVLAVALVFSWRSCINERDAKDNAIRTIGARDTILQVVWDKYGRQRSTLQEREMTLQVVQQAHDSEMIALRAEFGAKIKNLQSRTVVHVVTTDTVYTTVHDTVRPDGVEGKRFLFTDEWARINGTLFDTTAALDYAIRTGVILDRTWKRPGFLKRKELYLDITMTNPHTTLMNVQTFVIKPDPKKWWETDGAKCGASFLAGYFARGK